MSTHPVAQRLASTSWSRQGERTSRRSMARHGFLCLQLASLAGRTSVELQAGWHLKGEGLPLAKTDMSTWKQFKSGLGCRCAAMVPDLEGPNLGNSSPEAMSMPGTHLNITQRFYTWRGNHGPKKERGQWHQRPPCYDAGRSLVGSKCNQSADGLFSVWTSGRGPESTFEEPSTKK